MNQFLNYRLIKDALKELSEKDFLAKAILDYNNFYSQVKESDVNQKTKKLYNMLKDTKNLYNLILDNLKNDVSKLDDKNDIEQLISLYIINNFKNLCNSNSLQRFYDKIFDLRKTLEKDFSIKMQAAIMLRSIFIIKQMLNDAKVYDANRLLSFLDIGDTYNKQIMYIVYYGIYIGYSNDKLKNDEIITTKLLNNKDKLPDSIIKQICGDKQFKDYKLYSILILMILIFCADFNINYEHGVLNDKIKKFFNNDVNDLSSTAEFLDLTNLLTNINDQIESGNLDFTFVNDIINIIIGIKQLDRKEDEDTYGNI